MNRHDEFLKLQCKASNLDVYVVRSAILQALKACLPGLSGTLLDIGCGCKPYEPLVLSPPGRVTRYIGLDLKQSGCEPPDLEWDGVTIPLDDCAVDCAMATEVLEHCPEPGGVLAEACRVLKPGGVLFLTVPFLWPPHCVPYDEYRYTPFSLERHLCKAGFVGIDLRPLGGWDASLAQMIGLWVRRRPFSPRKRTVLSHAVLPIVRFLLKRDYRPSTFHEGAMITGISGTARKPAA